MNNRVIKFRVWDKLAKQMIYPNSHMSMDLDGHAYNLQNGAGGADYELMQFSGLYGKNKKEIYEGDIICLESFCDYQIVWDKEWARFDILQIQNQEIYWGVEFHLVNWSEVEVKGNIFENSELLK